MKTGEERGQLAKEYIESTHGTKMHAFCYADVHNSYCKGFAEGREDAEADCNNTESLGGWLNKFKALQKLAEKAELFVTAEIGLTYRQANVTIYEYKNKNLGSVLFRANNGILDNTAYRMMEYLLMAEEFIYKYTANTEENLEKKLESLRTELAATRIVTVKKSSIASMKERLLDLAKRIDNNKMNRRQIVWEIQSIARDTDQLPKL